MSAKLDAIADAVADELNGAGLSLPFTASRPAVNRNDLKDFATLVVTVDGDGERSAVYSRKEDRHEYDVLIAVRKQVAFDKAAIDPLAALVDEIASHMKRLEFHDLEVSRTATEVVPYAADQLMERKLFASFVRVTFEGIFA